MRNLLALIGLMVVVGVGVGYWRGWYKVDWKTASDGTVDVNIKANAKQISADTSEGLKVAGEKIGSVADSLKNKDGQPTDTWGTPLPVKPTPSPAAFPAPR